MTRKIAIVPAAGSGSRMGGERPKQYLPLAGRPLVFHTLQTLCACDQMSEVYVVLAREDTLWHEYDWSELAPKLTPLFCGGATRSASVANALASLRDELREDDWVLVHDAARACLSQSQLQRLIEALAEDAVGGLLAVPVADTLKRSGADDRVAATSSREGLWQAQTPQMFRYGLLRRALDCAPGTTDEAGAVEALGLAPRLVASDMTNFKITYPADIELAEWILARRRTL